AGWGKGWTASPRQSPAQARSTVASAGPPPAGTHAGQAASFWVEPSARRRAGVGSPKSDVGRTQDEAQRSDTLGRSLDRSLGRSLGRAGGGGRVGEASQHRRPIDRHAEIEPPGFRPFLPELPPAAPNQPPNLPHP